MPQPGPKVSRFKFRPDLPKYPLLLCALVAAALFPQPAQADVDDIVLETTGSFSGVATGSDLERTFTSSSVNPPDLQNPNGFVVVTIAIHDKRWTVKSSGVVWGSTTIGTSRVTSRDCGACANPSPSTEIWGIAIGTSKPTGTISVTVTTTTSGLDDPEIAFAYYIFTNVLQTSTWGSNGGNESTAITSAWLGVDAAVRSAGIAIGALDSTSVTAALTNPALTGETERMNVQQGNLRAFGSTMPEINEFVRSRYTLSANAKWAGSIISIIPASTPTAVRLSTFEAVATPAGTKVRWRTESEISNLGFNIYREENGVRSRANRSLIAGSALMVGPRTELSAGRSYEWSDPTPAPDGTVRYWLEAIDLDGSTELLGPESPEPEEVQPGKRNQHFSGVAFLETLGRGAPPSEAEPGFSAQPIADVDSGLSAVARSVSLSPLSSDTSNARAIQWALAASPAAKIGVTREGWYRVTRSALAAAGYDPGTDTKYLQLFADGVEQPILVREGTDTAIEFFGTPIDTPYAGTRTYWLVRGNRPGLRVSEFDSRRSRPSSVRSFPFTVERKDRTIYFAALTNNGDASNFFGPVVSATPAVQQLTLKSLDTSARGPWPLQVVLQGVTTNVSHVVEVHVNGNSAGFLHFKDQERHSSVLYVPGAWLREGTNDVSLVARGEDEDVSLVDTVKLTYGHEFVADQGALKLTARAGAAIAIAGFSDASVRVIDVTDPADIIELPVEVSKSPSGYEAATTIPARGQFNRTLVAFSSSRVLSPASVSTNQPSAWHAHSGQVDLVIVSNRAFLNAAEDLRARREREGLTVKLADVEDVYDENSFGTKDPYAIRTFLKRARAEWGTRYVLLVGDATIDPRNYLGRGDFDFVPSKLVPTELLKTASDDWFVDFDEDGLPEMAIGRLSVKTQKEAATVVSKIAAFEDGVKAGAPWLRKVVHVADQDDPPATNPFSFTKAALGLSELVPSSVDVETLLVGELGMPAAREAVVSRLNQGSLLFTYVGHGTQDSWSKLKVFDSEDGSALTNGARLPVVVTMNCLNGLFVDPYADSLAEVLLTSADGGSAAVWASSALTEPNGQGVMAKALYASLFSAAGVRLGDATIAAKAAVRDSDVRRTWVLFGDPTMKLR